MDSALNDEVQKLIQDFTIEPAYQKSHMLSGESSELFAKMQSELVNAHHLLGDVGFLNDGSLQNIDIAAAVANLETFIQHASAAKELRLISPDHLNGYQQRSLKIIKALDNHYKV